MMIEECSELIQALCKLGRAYTEQDCEKALERIRDEMADVSIMWQQMEKVFNTSDDDIGKRYIKKMERLKERLEPCQNATSQNTTVTNV
jgi:NTP pyrophosphatase (non-canonical NTP hydrolase)